MGLGAKTVSGGTPGSGRMRRNKSFRMIAALFVFLLCMAILLTYVNNYFFETDEGDIYSTAVALTHGQLLYKESVSQHMPVMYYIAAVFNLLGAETVYEYRICFYLFFSLMWALCVIWYGGKIPFFTLVFCPLMYVTLINRITLDTTILSEHAQAIGMNILFYELICYDREGCLKVSNLSRISLAIFLSFGSAFTSIFPIFFFAMTVLAIDIKRYYSSRKCETPEAVRGICRKYWRIMITAAIPFAGLAVYYLLTDSLSDFYYWAYEFNVDIYSQYQRTGSSALESMFVGFTHLLEPIQLAAAGSSSKLLAVFTGLSLLSIVLIGIVHRSVIVSVGLLFILNACETRGGILGFHSIHALMLQCALLGYSLGSIIGMVRRKAVRFMISTAIFLLVLYLSRGQAGNYPFVLKPFNLLNNKENQVVDILTEEGEEIGNSTLRQAIYIESETVTGSIVAGGTKWMWDGAGERAMAQLRAKPPRVYILDDHHDVWGYSLEDYAPELVSFVHENYIPLDRYGLGEVYVLKSYYEEAGNIIKSNYGETVSLSSMRNSIVSIEECDLWSMIDVSSIRDGLMNIRGWAFIPGEDAREYETYVILNTDNRECRIYKATKYNRTDVSETFGDNKFIIESGFEVMAEAEDSVRMEAVREIIALRKGDRLYVDTGDLDRVRDLFQKEADGG